MKALQRSRIGQWPVNLAKRPLRAVLFLLILIFFIMPIARLVYMAFSGESGLTFIHFKDLLAQPRTWVVLKNTMIVVGGSTLIASAIGIMLAWLLAYTDLRGKKLMLFLLYLPLIIPSYISTLAWTQFLGPDGLFEKMTSWLPFAFGPLNLYSMTGIVLVMGISHYPLVYLLTVNVFKKIPRDMEQAARCAGASRRKAFVKVVLPLAFPGIVGGGFLAFLASLDNFGIPAFLGIPARISVLSTYIYEQVIGFGTSAFSKAAVLSVLLGIIALAGAGIQWLFLRRARQTETAIIDHEPRYFLGRMRLSVECLLWLFFAITSIVPLIAMVMTSLLPAYGVAFSWDSLTLKNYAFILETSPKAKQAMFNSLKLALVTTGTGVVIGTLFAYLRVRRPNRLLKTAEGVISLPYALPGTVLALAMIFTWMEPVPGWNPGLYGSILIMFIAYMTRFLILQVRGSVTAFMQVDESMEEAARVSGTNGLAKWRKILVPLILPGLISGSLLVFLTALTELTVSSMLWSAKTETIGVVILNFENAGSTAYSTAFSSLIVGCIFIGGILMLILQSLWKRKVARQA